MRLLGHPDAPPLVTFRSRLEAHWAHTLDIFDIKWSYEVALFTLPEGQRYLPDFYLDDLNTWLEVKGAGVPGIDKTTAFAHWRPDLVVAGYAPSFVPGDDYKMSFQGVVRRCGFAICPDCGRYQWTDPETGCRACEAYIPDFNFYPHSNIPFHLASWAGG
jgi:hypothetical protein